MSVLGWLTVAWAVVLVSAVAASLIAILVHLRRIGRSLARAGASLSVVRDRTGPLEAPLGRLRDTSTRLSSDFDAARHSLDAVGRVVERVAERSGAARTTS